MTEPIDDEALLDRFRIWLRDARAETEGFNGDLEPSTPQPEVGLYRLVEEFTALRHEVKLETKGSRSLQEQVETLLPTLRQAIDQFRTVAPKEEQAVQGVARPLAEAIADLDEALERGRLEIEKARNRLAASAESIVSLLNTQFRARPWFRKIGLRAYHEQVRDLVAQQLSETQPGLFVALLEGYGLIQSRLKRAMDAGQIRRIECAGRPVDPGQMNVIEVVDAPDQPAGHVVDEVRRGYTWRGRVLRYAEVRAARERLAEIEDETDSTLR